MYSYEERIKAVKLHIQYDRSLAKDPARAGISFTASTS